MKRVHIQNYNIEAFLDRQRVDSQMSLPHNIQEDSPTLKLYVQ